MKNKKIRTLKFSVLMTVYDKEDPKTLDDALNSIEIQTAFPDEIVLVKDGKLTESLDNIISKHSDKYGEIYKIISLDENHGRGYASKVGIDEISNDWFARMDSDDISFPDRFEIQLAAINKYQKLYPKLAVVGGQVSEFIGQKNNVIGYRKVPLTPLNIKKFAAFRSPINNPTVMINRSALLNIGNYSDLNVLEDYDLWIRFLSAGYELVNIPNILVNMRVSNDMYRRRGGFKYLCTYIRQKKEWKHRGIGNNKTVTLSSLAMLGNILFPLSIRKVMYQRILHRKK